MSVSNCSSLRDEVAAALDRIRPKKAVLVSQQFFVPDEHGEPVEVSAEEFAAYQRRKPGRPRGETYQPAAQRRYEQLVRTMLLIELVAPLREGATIAQLLPDLRNEFGMISERTLRRDLNALEAFGLVTHEERCERTGRPARWIWHSATFRGVVHRRVAEETAAIHKARRQTV